MATGQSLSLRTKRPREQDDLSNVVAGSMTPDLADFVEEHTRPRKQAKMALPSRLKPLMINSSSANRKAKTDAALKAVQRGLQRRFSDRYQDPESENTDAIPITIDQTAEVVDPVFENEEEEITKQTERETLDASTQTSELLLGNHAASRTDLILLPSTSLERTSSAVYYCAFNRIWSDKPCEECALKDWGGPLEVIEEEPEDGNPAATARGQERYMSIGSENASTIILTGGHHLDDIETGCGSPRYSSFSDKENTRDNHSSSDESGLDEEFSGGAYLDEDALRDVEDYIDGSSSGDEKDRTSGDEEAQSGSDLSDGTTVGCHTKKDDSEDSADGSFEPRGPPLKHGDEVVSSPSDASESELYYDN